jgi:Transposase DDE domain
MLLGQMFAPFLAESPLSVMARATVEHALTAAALDHLFDQHAETQYTRDLLFSSVVDLMSLVVTNVQPSVSAAYQARLVNLSVSLTSVYNKLNGIEDQVAAELVRHTAQRLEPVIRQLGGLLPEPVPGYRMRILDGNHLAATEHRLPETRDNAAAPLPGQTLAVLEPALLLITDLVPCQDGHAQERSLLDHILAKVRGRDLWVADRNFCVRHFLLSIAARSAFFIIREHQGLSWEPAGKVRGRGRVAGGRLREQRVAIRDDQGQRVYLRRVVVELDQPTRAGDTAIALLTNLPEGVDARTVARAYRKRWTIEGAFQELTETLHSEVNTLCYPRAALFAFCVAVAAYNVLGALKGALRATHGAEKIEKGLSSYHVALEVAGVHRGMMIAIPAEHWRVFATMAVEQFAEVLRELASKVRLVRYQKHPRGPKKPPVKRRYSKKHPHVSTAQLLEARRAKKQAAKK